jgi:flavin reductase (DIM6/NTAB) family NADH-FMN oxidoreductase RutF
MKSLGPKTLVYPAPVLVIGSYGDGGRANAMVCAWGGICCSAPPEVAISLRKATATHGNITARKAFTINIPSEKLVEKVDYFGTVSGRDVDKFEKTGLTPVKSELVDAPYIKEFPLILECSLVNTIELGLHTHFIGEVKDVKVDEAVLDADGILDVQKVLPFMFAPDSRIYFGISRKIGEAFSIGKKP